VLSVYSVLFISCSGTGPKLQFPMVVKVSMQSVHSVPHPLTRPRVLSNSSFRITQIDLDLWRHWPWPWSIPVKQWYLPYIVLLYWLM